MKEIFNNIDMPAQFTDEMEAQITRLNETKMILAVLFHHLISNKNYRLKDYVNIFT